VGGKKRKHPIWLHRLIPMRHANYGMSKGANQKHQTNTMPEAITPPEKVISSEELNDDRITLTQIMQMIDDDKINLEGSGYILAVRCNDDGINASGDANVAVLNKCQKAFIGMMYHAAHTASNDTMEIMQSKMDEIQSTTPNPNQTTSKI